MKKIIKISNDSQTDRELFVLPLSSHEELGPDLAVPPEHFVCLLAWDASAVTVDDISNLAVQLLKAGAAYFVCWGPDCERVHDIIDEIASDPDSEFCPPEDSVIMTTWHDQEPLSEAVSFALNCTVPDEFFEETTHSLLAISIGRDEWAEEIRTSFASRK